MASKKVREIALEARNQRDNERATKRAEREAERLAREANRPQLERQKDREMLEWIENESTLAEWFPGKQWELVDRRFPVERSAVVRPKGETDVLIMVVGPSVFCVDPYRTRPAATPTNWALGSIRVHSLVQLGDAIATFDEAYARMRGDGSGVAVSPSGRPGRQR